MKTIGLTKGLTAIVDDADFERVSAFKWCALVGSHRTYAYRRDSTRKSVYLHRYIMDASATEIIDHKDRDGLNCSRANLRIATSKQNQGNRGINKNNRAGFKGVRWTKGAWQAAISNKSKRVYLGRYPTPELAARAYDTAARASFGEFALTNF